MNHTMMLHIHTKMVLLILLTLSLLKSSVFALSDPRYISYYCQQKNSYTAGSVFEANLNYTLFTEFRLKATVFGFRNYTQGTHHDDQVYALFYRSGDADADATASCQACVNAAARKITDVCKFAKEGIVWFEECTLRYANRTIFSIDEEFPVYQYYNNTGIVNEDRLDSYKQVLDNTMDALIDQAAYGERTLKGFATTQVILSSSEMLQVLAQCTPDIVGNQCYRCLSVVMRKWDRWANTVVYLPSCLIRYDLYVTTVHSSPISPVSRPSSPLKGFHIAVIVVILMLTVLAVIGGYLLIRRCSPSSPGVEDGLQKFSFSEVKQITANFITELGKGDSGVVYYGHLPASSKEVAVKLLTELDGLTQFNNEINVLKMIHHDNVNVVSLLGYCEDETNLALVFEFMNKRDLKEYMSNDYTGPSFSWKERLQIAIDTAKGLCYLHDHCNPLIVHRDVKPANILLHETNEKLEAKVASFGYSKIFPEGFTTVETQVVCTPGYGAPEYVATGILSKKVDVYSFGVVLIQLITGKVPTPNENITGTFQNDFDTQDTETILDSRVSRDADRDSVWTAAEVAKSCVHADAADRPEMSCIVLLLRRSLDMELRNITANPLASSTS